MKKLFISQPMRGKSDKDILAEREKAISEAKAILRDDVELIDTFFGTGDMTHALEFLGESIKSMANADVAYFADGWENARGCKIEHDCAVQYGIRIVGDNNG